MKDFGDRYRNVKAIIKGTISDDISHKIIYNMQFPKRNSVRHGVSMIGFDGVTRPSEVIRRRGILSISYKLLDGDLKFNKKRMKLLSFSERLEVTSRILEELE